MYVNRIIFAISCASVTIHLVYVYIILISGTKPTNVTDFKCKVYDYEYMECSFTRPKNMLLTQYELQYGISDDVSSLSLIILTL